ncbi:MAG TPA: DHH family phosphoesterase [Polyangia bacterium]
MHRYYVFNGDADGLCALQQLRLAAPEAERGQPSTLVTGVKRDIALLDRVTAAPGDACTVLDISLDVNRAGLERVLAAGASVRYFDHHFAGDIPANPNLDAHIDLAPNVCTSILVDRYLEGRCRAWAVVGAFGDSLVEEGKALAQAAGISAAATERLAALGVAINYNAYGETIEDLHVSPTDLAAEMLKYTDPLELAQKSKTYRALAEGYKDDLGRARALDPFRKAEGAIVFLLPDAAWARRVSGTLANDLSKIYVQSALAIVSHKTGGGFLVSLRVPRDSAVSAEAFCRQYPTGGGRKTAAGINHLPADAFEAFVSAFETQFGRPAAAE